MMRKITNKEREKQANFGALMLDELGFYTDIYGRVIDQETDTAVGVKGKMLRYIPEGDQYINKDEMLFDPLNNQMLASNMFTYFINNRYNGYVSMFNIVESSGGKGTLNAHVGEADNVIQSGEYYMDSIKYADMIMRMNGNNNPNLSFYDDPNRQRRGNK